MVKITNGSETFSVTRGAFDGIFSHQGYHVIEDVVKDSKKFDNASSTNANIEEKPISQWTKEEVKQYAKDNGIDLTGTKNVDEAKGRIKFAMESK